MANYEVTRLIPKSTPPVKFLLQNHAHVVCTSPVKEVWAMSPLITLCDIKPFASKEEAIKFSQRHSSPEGVAVALPFIGMIDVHTEGSEALFTNIKELSIDVEKRFAKVLHQVVSTKSKTKGCKVCGSSINRQHIKLYCDCPVCHATSSLLSDSQLAYVKLAISRLTAAKNNKLVTMSTKGVGYLVYATDKKAKAINILKK